MSASILAVVVEDEFLVRERLKELLAEHGDVTVVAEAANGRDAVQVIERHHPDLVMLDISLPQLDGFEVLSCLNDDLPNVIFTTAYDTHAIKAFEIEAVDYLLKPVERERLAKALDRVRSRIGRNEPAAEGSLERVIEAGAEIAPRSRIAVRSGEMILFLRPAEIDAVEALGNYVRIHRGSETYVIRQTLLALERRLAKEGFVRIQRSVLVNVERIAALQRDSRDASTVVLTGGRKYPLSPRYRDNLVRAVGEF